MVPTKPCVRGTEVESARDVQGVGLSRRLTLRHLEGRRTAYGATVDSRENKHRDPGRQNGDDNQLSLIQPIEPQRPENSFEPREHLPIKQLKSDGIGIIRLARHWGARIPGYDFSVATVDLSGATLVDPAALRPQLLLRGRRHESLSISALIRPFLIAVVSLTKSRSF